MNKLFSSLLVFFCFIGYAQTKAVTENGDEVILYEDGTWKYVNDNTGTTSTETPTNKKLFSKDAGASFLVKSQKFNIGVWINPKTWSFEKGEEGGASEFSFKNKTSDLYGMMIAEEIEIPVETLKMLALENAVKAGPDFKIVKEEYRTVNGIKVLYMRLAGTINGIKCTYTGYYYSNSKGSVQLVTFTAQNLVDKYNDDIEKFLNGFVEL